MFFVDCVHNFVVQGLKLVKVFQNLGQQHPHNKVGVQYQLPWLAPFGKLK